MSIFSGAILMPTRSPFQPIVVRVRKEDVVVVRGEDGLIITALVDGREHRRANRAVLFVVRYLHVVKVHRHFYGRALGQGSDAVKVRPANFDKIFARDVGVYLIYEARLVHYVQIERLDVQSNRAAYGAILI